MSTYCINNSNVLEKKIIRDKSALLDCLRRRLSLCRENKEDQIKRLPFLENNVNSIIMGSKLAHYKISPENEKGFGKGRIEKITKSSYQSGKKSFNESQNYITKESFFINKRMKRCLSNNNLKSSDILSRKLEKKPSLNDNMFLTINKLKTSNNQLSNYICLENKKPIKIRLKRECLLQKKDSRFLPIKKLKEDLNVNRKHRNLYMKELKIDQRMNDSNSSFEDKREEVRLAKENIVRNRRCLKPNCNLKRTVVFSKLNNKIFCKKEIN